MVRYRIIYGIVFVFLLLTFIFQNNRLCFCVLLFWMIFPIVLWGWLRHDCRQIRMRMGMMENPCLGKTFRIRIIAKGNQTVGIGRISGYVTITNEVKQKIDKVRFEMRNLDVDFEADVNYQSRECGRVTVQVGELKACDCMGITTYRLQNKLCFMTRILPQMNKKEEVMEISPFGDEFVGIRNYHEGDMMSSVHWKLSAKNEELVVKEFGNQDGARQRNDLPVECQSCTFSDLCYNEMCR